MNNYMPIKWTTWKKWKNSEKCTIPKTESEEIVNMNRPIISNDIESVIKNQKLPTNKSPGPVGFTDDFC